MYFKYKLFTPEGDQAGDAHYAVPIPARRGHLYGRRTKLKVRSLVPVESGDELNGYTGFLMVEAA